MDQPRRRLRFCGERLVDLYKYELQDIYLFLRKISLRPATYVDDASKGPELQRIYRQLLTLCPLDKNTIDLVKNDVQAENFEPRQRGKVDPDFKPAQHIYRRLTTDEDPASDEWSKIEVNPDATWRHNYPPNTGTGILPYWSHYDLLGLFLSLLGPAPEGSQRFNFFLPLTAVYARWCFTIGGLRNRKKLQSLKAMAFKPQPGHGPPPTILQCTWIERADSKFDFSLGASMGGQHWGPIDKQTKKNELGDWKTRLQKSRFGLLTNWNGIEGEVWIGSKDKKEHKFEFDTSPGIESGSSLTKFGNCGETYPFIHMLGTHRTANREEMQGIALNSSFLAVDALWNNYSLDLIHVEAERKREDEDISFKYMWSPCKNCKFLIKVAQAELNNFRPDQNVPTARDRGGEDDDPQAESGLKENGHLKMTA